MTLKQRLQSPEVLLAPGVFNAWSGMLAERAGFGAVYLSGASIAYTRLGRPDIGLVTATEVCDVLATLRERIRLPILVDADTGFGNALNVQRTVREFERAGGGDEPGRGMVIQLEDQTMPKRCGHLNGKSLISKGEMVGKLKAASDARRSAETLIMARTDAIAVEGIDAAMDRAEAYLEAGADALFIEALKDDSQMRLACERFANRVPLLANMVEGGKTPLRPAAELGQLGFRIVIFPGGLVRLLSHAAEDYFNTLQRDGTTDALRDRMLDFDGLNSLIGTPALLDQGKRYAAEEDEHDQH